MAIVAAKYDEHTIEHYTIRWNEDLTREQRATIASEIEKERYIPSYDWVKPSDLYVDESYQRPLSEDRVWQIATTFTWRLFNPLWISDRGTKMYVVDGRHRLAAASILGAKLIPQIPIERRRMASVEEEAITFVELQEKRRKITSAQRFAAKLVARDPHALILQSLIRKHGFKVRSESFGGSALNAPKDEITAVGTLEKIYRAGGKTRVDSVLAVIREAWDGVPPTTSAWMLRAVNRIFEREPGTKADTVARRLHTKEPWGLIERGMRFAHSNEIPQDEAISDVLLRVVNE